MLETEFLTTNKFAIKYTGSMQLENAAEVTILILTWVDTNVSDIQTDF